MGEDAGCTSFLFCLLLLDDTYCYYFTNTIYKSSVKIQEIQRRKKKKQKSIPNPSPQGKKIEVSIHPDISFCIFKCLKYKIFHFKNSCLNSLSLILSSPSPPPLVYHYQFKMQFFNQIEKPVETTFTMSLLGTKEEMQKIPITLWVWGVAPSMVMTSLIFLIFSKVRPDTTPSSQPIMTAPNALADGLSTQAQYLVTMPPQPHPVPPIALCVCYLCMWWARRNVSSGQREARAGPVHVHSAKVDLSRKEWWGPKQVSTRRPWVPFQWVLKSSPEIKLVSFNLAQISHPNWPALPALPICPPCYTPAHNTSSDLTPPSEAPQFHWSERAH